MNQFIFLEEKNIKENRAIDSPEKIDQFDNIMKTKYEKIKDFIKDGRDTKTVQKIALNLLAQRPIIGIWEDHKKAIKNSKKKERL